MIKGMPSKEARPMMKLVSQDREKGISTVRYWVSHNNDKSSNLGHWSKPVTIKTAEDYKSVENYFSTQNGNRGQPQYEIRYSDKVGNYIKGERKETIREMLAQPQRDSTFIENVVSALNGARDDFINDIRSNKSRMSRGMNEHQQVEYFDSLNERILNKLNTMSHDELKTWSHANEPLINLVFDYDPITGYSVKTGVALAVEIASRLGVSDVYDDLVAEDKVKAIQSISQARAKFQKYINEQENMEDQREDWEDE